MRSKYLLVLPAALVFLLGLTACAPGWGQPGEGGMMGGEGGMMGGEGGMMGGEGGMMGGEGGMMGGEGGMMGGEGGMMGGEGGMMGGDGGMMGGQGGMMAGMPMMGGMMGYYPGVPTPLSHQNARAIAGNYLTSTNNPDLGIEELEEYSHNYYLAIIEKSTGQGAVEIIIDRYSGSSQPEPQSMMWNSKYGMMGGSQQTQMTVTPQQAMKVAQDFLEVAYPDTEADEIVAYYGYYTIMTKLEGEHYGMLSVNGYSGDVWYHTWHGMFLSEVE